MNLTAVLADGNEVLQYRLVLLKLQALQIPTMVDVKVFSLKLLG